MQKQEQKQAEPVQTTNKLQALVSKQQSMKRVTVQYKSCCGCGCRYEDYTLEVPLNMDVEEGDIVDFDVISKYHI